MKKALFTLMILCFCGLITAQEMNKNEFKMALGDTVVWKPFDNCNNNSYDVNGPKIISFKAIKFGECIQVTTKSVGKSSIIATCNDDNSVAVASFVVYDPNDDVPVVVEKPVKPATQAFTGVYKFNPPTDNFFITINDLGSNVKETYMKHGDDEAHNDGVGLDRFWNVKTGMNWYYCPDAQGWTDDVKWEFDPFEASFPILNSFDEEVVNKSNLSNYYVGMEKVLTINCWHFFVEFEDEDMVIQYWVDPANGCTLKRQVDSNPAKEVTVYDLKYTKLYFGPSFKKGLHDTRR